MKISLLEFCEKYGISVEKSEIIMFFEKKRAETNIPFILAGGAVRNLVEGKEKAENDYDIFFRSEKDFLEFKKIEEQKHTMLESEMNVSYSEGEKKIQLIKMFYPSVEEILDSFDFTICQFAIDMNESKEKMLYCGELSLWDLARKKLVVNKITFPIASLRRFLKYTTKGFHACGGAMKVFLNDIISKNPQGIENEIKYID